MIVRRKLRAHRVFLIVWKPTVAYIFVGLSVCILHEELNIKQFAVPFYSVGALGTALAILLGFRNNSSYDRWWEARKLWGQILNSSRTFARQTLSFVTQPQLHVVESRSNFAHIHQELVHRHIAYVNALRLFLRKQSDKLSELEKFLSSHDFARVKNSSNPPAEIIQIQSEQLAELRTKGYLGEFPHIQMDKTLTTLIDCQGGCERIKNTPLPRLYDFTPAVFLSFYVLVLPLGLIDAMGWLTPLLSVPISILFRALDGIGRAHEDPFEMTVQDVPMSALCRTIEINLKEQLQEAEVPPPLQAVDGFLY